MDNNQMEKIKCSNTHNCLFSIGLVDDEACAGVTVSAISFGIEFLQVQSQKNMSSIKDSGLLMNEKELVLFATTGGEERKKG